MDPRNTVREGYDKVSRAYRGDTIAARDAQCYCDCADFLRTRLLTGSRVLDLGCGCGIPLAKELSKSHRVTGVDLSPVQIERARALVPNADFRCADMTQITMPNSWFDAVVALYSIIHVPLADQPGCFADVGRWLKPNGWLVCVVGHREWTGTEENWLGVPGATMFWSHADQATYHQWLTDNGFRVEPPRFIPEGRGGHTMFMAQKIANQVPAETACNRVLRLA